MKNILRNSNFGFKNRIMRMALLRSEPRKLNRSLGGLRAGMVFAAFMTFAAPVSRAALSAGDIAFVMYNADATPDTIAFVALVDIPAGEEIKFTDNGWTSSNAWRASEGIFTYTAPAGGVSKGSVVTVSLSGPALSATGDQIIAYQGTSTMIAALNNEGAGVWQADATSANTSAVPQDLVNGTTAVALNEIDNAIYNGTLSGTKEELLAAINNNANWTPDDSTVYTWTRGSFTVGAASGPSIATTGTLNSFTATAGTASAAQTFTVTGSNLTADITVTAPTDFEVASDGATFGNTATITQSSGAASGTVSVRVAASASAGAISGNVTLASTTASGSVAVSGFVSGPVALPYGPETFETSQGQWYTYSVSSTKNWSRVLLGTDYVMQINGYDNTAGAPAANDWLILGPINVPSGISSLVANFNIQKAFASGADSEFNLKVSSNYSGSGDPTSATWDTVNFTKSVAQASGSTTMDASGNVVLPSSLHGQSAVYVAFHLEAASATGTSRWSIDDFALTTTTVPPAPSALSYTPSSISGTVGVAISSVTPTVTGTVDTYSVDPDLPDGLSIDAGSGVISGTPTAVAASDTYTVTAANDGGNTTATVTVVVAKGTPSITAVPLASAITVGQALIDSVLSEGTASVAGAFAWTAPSTEPGVGTPSYGVTFTPTDTVNYTTAATTVSLTVNSAGSTFEGAYPGKIMTDIAPNGLSYLANYAFGGSDGVAPTLPIMDNSDPTKLRLVVVFRTDDPTLPLSGLGGETTMDLAGSWSTSGVSVGPSTDASPVPANTVRKVISVVRGSEESKRFLRATITK